LLISLGEGKEQSLGLQKMTLELGDETMGLWSIMHGVYKPKLPEDLPENARKAITGEKPEKVCQPELNWPVPQCQGFDCTLS